MIFTARFLWLLTFGAFFFLLSAVSPVLTTVALGWNGLLLALCLLDYLTCPRPARALTAERQVDDALSVRVENTVMVRVQNQTKRWLRFVVRDEPPGDFPLSTDSPRQVTMTLAPYAGKGFTYPVTPPARGDYHFGDIYFRVYGFLGLVQRQGKVPAAKPIAVYPNVRAVGEYELLLRRAQLSRTGTRRARVGGGGREFSALRDYTPDDEYRTIDWKATARRGRVTARTYETERSQDILLLVDIGRLMRQEVDYAQKLDHVVNAALMLSHVVTEADDRIGILTFAEAPREWLAPRRGRAQVTGILQALYAARADIVETDYREAFRYLNSHWRKRSLVVLFTDIADPDSSALLLREVTYLARHHLVCVVVVRDPLLSARVRQEPTQAVHVYEKAVAAETLRDRRSALTLLEQRGVLVVDAEPQELSVALVAKYLSVKHRSQL